LLSAISVGIGTVRLLQETPGCDVFLNMMEWTWLWCISTKSCNISCWLAELLSRLLLAWHLMLLAACCSLLNLNTQDSSLSNYSILPCMLRAALCSWGVLLWEMLTGSRAYAGMAAPAVVCQVAVLKRGLAIPKNLPAALDDLLRRALSSEPEVRPSFAEVVTVLTRFVQHSRAVDWEEWQAAVEAAHVEDRAAAAAAAAAGEASPQSDAAAGQGDCCAAAPAAAPAGSCE
jgi:hypothetical protein